MDFIKGNNRPQITFSTLESQIEESNPVRFVDAFVEYLHRKKKKFLIVTKSQLAFIFSITNRLRKTAALKLNVMK